MGISRSSRSVIPHRRAARSRSSSWRGGVSGESLAISAAALAGALSALALWMAWFEPRRTVVRRHTLQLPGWPATLDGLRLALVSDLHCGAPHVDADRLTSVVNRVNRQRPDLIALLGDFVDPEVTGARPVQPEAVAARLGLLRAPLGSFAVLGNHDWRHDGPRIQAALTAAGIHVLENDSAPALGTPAPLWVTGLADAGTRRPRPREAFASAPSEAAVLCLAHDPDVFARLPERAALTVSGHTHGGQVNLPGLRRRVIPSRYGDRYAAGHIVEGGRHLYVTRGIGTSGLPLRLLAPPEIVILTLSAAPPG